MQAPTFNGDAAEYPGWCLQMKAVLHEQKLLDVVEKGVGGQDKCGTVIAGDDGDEVVEHKDDASVASGLPDTEANQRKADKAFALLTCAIKSTDLLALVSDVPQGNAYEVWHRLRRHFTRNTQANKTHLMAQFYQSKMASGESVSQFAARIKTGVLTLKSLEEIISPSTMQHVFVSGLGTAFQQLREVLPLLNIKNFESVVDAALVVESQATVDRAQSGGRQVETAHYAGASHSSGGGGRGRGFGLGPCWRCGKQGHVKMNCSNPPQTCGTCGKLGHGADDCFKKNAGGGPAANGGFSRAAPAPVGARQVAMTAEVQYAHAYSVDLVTDSKVVTDGGRAEAADQVAAAATTGGGRAATGTIGSWWTRVHRCMSRRARWRC